MVMDDKARAEYYRLQDEYGHHVKVSADARVAARDEKRKAREQRLTQPKKDYLQRHAEALAKMWPNRKT